VQLRTIRLATRDSFSEHSFHYILETVARAFRLPIANLAEGRAAPWGVKAVRKLFRTSIESLFRYTACAAGRGAAIDAVFSKDESPIAAATHTCAKRVCK
jgi:hypothetical protein